MQEKQNQRRSNLLIAGLIICIAVLVFQQLEIRGLWHRVDMLQDLAYRNTGDFMALESKLEARQAQLEMKLEQQQSQIERLSTAAGFKLSTFASPSTDQLDALQPGLYFLTTDTKYDPAAEETIPYQITHITIDMEFESFDTNLNIGLARSGMIPIGVYFDYDNDGLADVDMAQDFAREIPVVGRKIAEAYDPVIAQNLYSIFVYESGNAEYTSVADLAQQAEDKSNYLWSFVLSQYQQMEKWVRDKLKKPQPGD